MNDISKVVTGDTTADGRPGVLHSHDDHSTHTHFDVCATHTVALPSELSIAWMLMLPSECSQSNLQGQLSVTPCDEQEDSWIQVMETVSALVHVLRVLLG